MVTQAIREVLDAFERLPDDERRTATAVILRRTIEAALPPLDDDSLCTVADDLFRALDAEELINGDGDKG